MINRVTVQEENHYIPNCMSVF